MIGDAADQLIDEAAGPGFPGADAARRLVAEEQLARPSARRTWSRLVPLWGGYAAAAVVGTAADDVWVWAACWFAMAWVLVGNAALVHETVHGHLFASPAANRALGTLAAAPLFVSWASYRAYHFEHHRRATRPGDPEGTPLRFHTRLAYVATMLAAGVAVTGEGFWFGLRTLAGRAPVWVRTAAQRRAILENLALLAAVVVLAVAGIALAPGPTLRLWLVPALLAMLLLAPFVFLPEHHGADGEGPILANTMTVVSNPVLRYVFWNTNYHAAHHLTPGVPFHAIGRVDALIAPDVAPRWRVRSYLAFHGARLRNEPPEGRAAH